MNERKSTRNHSNNPATNEQEQHISKADTQKDTGETKTNSEKDPAQANKTEWYTDDAYDKQRLEHG